MSRTLTTYKNPSILTLIETAGSIDALAAMRAEMRRAYVTQEITPSDKTARAWSDAFWVRVFELMTEQPRSAPYIFNVSLCWEKPHGLHLALEAHLQQVTKDLPSDADSLRIQKISI